MNDRFKFRFWHKSKNRYVNTEKLVLNDGNYTQVGTKQMNNGTYCSYIVNEFNSFDVIPEQCTGLKDKNGKLIYEGDIIELTRARNYGYIPKGSRLVIKWNTFDCCGFSTGIRGNLTKKCADNCIIVGNIHENTELLENEE